MTAQVLHFAVLPPEEADHGIVTDNAYLTAHTLDQAIDLLRRVDEEEEALSVIVVCGAQYAFLMREAVTRRKLQKANVFPVFVPGNWLKRPDAWLVSRAGNVAVVSTL